MPKPAEGPMQSPAGGRGGPRFISLDSWDEARRLCLDWLSDGAIREAFRLALAFHLGSPSEKSGRFITERFREAPLRFAVAMVQGIGNMVMLTPALRALRGMFPRAEIEVVGHSPALDVVRGWPTLDSCTELEDFDPGRERDALLLSMWSGQFKKAFSGYVTSGDVPAVEIEFVDFKRHESEFHLDLARALGYDGPMPDPHCSAAELPLPWPEGERLALLADTSNPDAEWQRKRWPHFRELAHRLVDRGYGVGLMGGPVERDAFDPTGWPRDLIDLQGRYSIPQTAYLIREAGLLIANDSGPAHIAGAVGAQAYVLFGPSLEAKNLPAGPGVHPLTSEIGCRPCQYLESWSDCQHNRCMELITVKQVLDALDGRQRQPAADGPPPEAEAPPAQAEPVLVDLGCGRFKRKGHIGIDVDPESAADIVCDVTEGIPLDTDSVDGLAADNLLEHIGDGFMGLMNEIWRVCKAGAEAEVSVPLFPSEKALADPTHRRYFTEETFSYLDRGSSMWRQFGAGYGFKPFRVLSRRRLAGELEVILTPAKETARPARAARRGGRSARRICFVSHNQPGAGGAEIAMHNVANGLSREGFEVTVVHNVRPFIHALPAEAPPDARYEIRWVEGPDLDAFHEAAAGSIAESGARFDVCMSLWRATSARLVEACHGRGIVAGMWCQNVQYAPERGNRSVFRLADFIVAVTPYARFVLKERFSRTEGVYVIPNACGEAYFRAYRDRGDGPIRRLLFFGRLADKQKGLGTLCDALHRLKNEGVEFTLDVVGGGPDEDAMRSRIGSLGLGEQVRFAGWKSPDELPAILAAHDLCVLPSNFEGCSLALIEAMAVGLPVVTTDVGGNPWLIADKKHGLMVRPRRPGLLAKALQWACAHPAEMALMGRWAHKKALKRYHWDRVIRDYRKLLSGLPAAPAQGDARRMAG